jgi:hypothetical protein
MDWNGLIAQIPLVVAFIWFSLKMQENNQNSMEKRDVAYLAAISQIVSRLDCHEATAQEIHADVKKALAIQEYQRKRKSPAPKASE